jgi:hypothetical protein
MRADEIVSGLDAFPRRGAGTDAARRTALWLAQALRREHDRQPHRDATIEPFWCRPNGALAHAWHAILGLAGSLVIVSDARLGGALVLAALLSTVADAVGGRSPARLLTREHASQNVVSRAAAPADARARLIVTANYDVGRRGLITGERPRALAAWARAHLAADGRLTPGWLGWLIAELACLVAVAVLRDRGAAGTAVGVVQLVLTTALLLQATALLELAGAQFGPVASDAGGGGTAVAVAVALVRALDETPSHRLAVELVLQGAGEGAMTGLRRHLRAERRGHDTFVLGIGPCVGEPRHWSSDGPAWPLRYDRRLRELAAAAGAAPYRGRGVSAPLPARTAGLAAVNLGSAGARPGPAAPDDVLRVALAVVRALDDHL